jgi:hypothetical protein
MMVKYCTHLIDLALLCGVLALEVRPDDLNDVLHRLQHALVNEEQGRSIHENLRNMHSLH